MPISVSLNKGILNSVVPPPYQVTYGTRTISLFGEISFLVNYENLNLLSPRQEAIEDILSMWGASPDMPVHKLTELFGCYVVVVEEGGKAVYLYVGSEITTPIYYGLQSGDEIFINTSWIDILRAFDQVKLSVPALMEMGEHNYVADHKTLFDGLHILKHYALYSINSDKLSLMLHTFPGMHTQPLAHYGIEDYLTALGCYKPYYPAISLAYSGGVDSRVLAYTYCDSIKELLTITQTEPYVSYSRRRERQSAQRLAQDTGIPFTDVIVNYDEVETFRPYFETFVPNSPFSSFLAVHYFHLAALAGTDAVMTGQSGDAIWDWGFHQIYFSTKRSHSTSSHSIGRDLSDLAHSRNFRSVGGRIASRYLSRYAMIHSYKGFKLKRFVNKRRTYGPEYNSLRAFPYKMFGLERAISRGSLGGAMSWARGAEAAGKIPLLPYLSPLALHVSSQIPQRHFFDLKAPLRRIYEEYDSSVIEQKMDLSEEKHKQPYVSSLFELTDSDIQYIQQFLDRYSSTSVRLEDIKHTRNRQNMHRMHLYYLFRFIDKQLEMA